MAKTRATHKYPTRSYRIRPEAAELIAAWAEYQNCAQGQLLERLLKRITPPTPISPEAARVRRAHAALEHSLHQAP